ncbi:uncharacterized protein LOC133792407 [Humulus lupulus]|uniref:uncharacterized protein LOC133792407 n=1 Tax=Humulus lupulus TaxID=3486 RepID=UPI002B4087BC|nr:uncharacterized protein LOC133792407 [Humulus lupulus]
MHPIRSVRRNDGQNHAADSPPAPRRNNRANVDNGNHPPTPPQPPTSLTVYPEDVDRLEPLYERFRKQHPLDFEGISEPIISESWISRIRSILDFMRVVGNDRVACVTHMIRKDVRIWCEVVEQIRDVARMAWDEFCEVFENKYYNVVVHSLKVNEFIGLVQGNLTITKYAQKFDRLAKFAFDQVRTDVASKDRFLRGIKPMIACDVEIVSTGGANTYAQVVERELTAEMLEDRLGKDGAARRDAKSNASNNNNDQKRKFSEGLGPYEADKKAKDEKGNKNGGNGKTHPECPKCKKRHQRECHAKACYQCGKEGHIKRNFPYWGTSRVYLSNVHVAKPLGIMDF